jgi:Immunoglobulin-like domain of bacterial spore germination
MLRAMRSSLLSLALLTACSGSAAISRPPAPAQAVPDTHDRIAVSTPAPNSVVRSPLSVRGEARGNWFFEASFPVTLLDASGQILAQAPAQAEGEWMTENFVPFSVTLTFKAPAAGPGTLLLERDNASGLPEHAAELRIPVQF